MKTSIGSNHSKTRGRQAAESENRLKQIRQASTLLKHVSDPTRLQIVLMLSEADRHAGAFGEALNQSQPAVSHHLALLRHGGVVVSRRQGKNVLYSLSDMGEELVSLVKDLAV